MSLSVATRRLCKWRSLAVLCKRSNSNTISSEAAKKISEEAQEDASKGKLSMPNKTYLLAEFFDRPENFGKSEIRPLYRPGRSWTLDELRLKSSLDLHKLWYILLKERNMLLTMREAYLLRAKIFPNPERIDRVQESMNNLELVVHERNDAYLRLETGKGASPPVRNVTSPIGFTYPEQAQEHYEPAEVTGKKKYEEPYLDDDAYLMQKLWNEKMFMKEEIATHDKYYEKMSTRDGEKFRLGLRKSFNRLEDMPKTIVAESKSAVS
uniref:Large ribosomal subunit protein uL29m n=1 Tax=Ditylenchus dipsaci TaxID=166011 RepID=A0A915D9E1_9BILA